MRKRRLHAVRVVLQQLKPHVAAAFGGAVHQRLGALGAQHRVRFAVQRQQGHLELVALWWPGGCHQVVLLQPLGDAEPADSPSLMAMVVRSIKPLGNSGFV